MIKQILLLCLLLLNSLLFAQQTEIVDFKTAKVDVVLRPQLKEIGIDVLYEFEILKDTDSIYLDLRTLDTYKVYQQSFEGTHRYSDKKIIFKSKFKKGEKHSVGLAAFTHPTKAMYFIDWNEKEGRKQVWTQGQGKYISNWLPSFDDVNEKVEFDFSITFDKDFEVIANGKLLKKESPNDSLTKWYFDMKQPMSSYLAAIAIGKYKKKIEISKSGIPLEMYYYPEDEAKFEPTYRYTKQIFDFLEEEIGVAYPWQNYKQVPVKDFLYAGMENTSTTLFSDSFVVDSIGFVDKNYVNVNAHELAHQWFGDLVTAKSGEHHWLQEGFATYYALLAEKEVFGDDYFYWKLYTSALQLQKLNDGKGESVMNPKASSLTFYQKGAWVLHALRTKVGEKPFKKSVQRYLNLYKFKSAETNDFIKIVEEESGQNLDAFVKTWLVKKQLPDYFYSFERLLAIDSSPDFSMYQYLGGMPGAPAQVASFRKFKTSKESATTCVNISQIFKLSQNELVQKEVPISEELLVNLVKNAPKDSPLASIQVYKEAFKTNNIKIRQAIAQTLTKIPLDLKLEYEDLLNDDSYVTKEAALYNLWSNFPENRKKYLEDTKNIQGFNDQSFRILWLTLAIVTKNYSGHDTPLFYNELSGYTHTKYHFEVRQNAFVFINELQSFTDKNLANLVNGALHHNWRFATFCRNLLDDLIKKEIYKTNFERTMNLLTEKEKAYLIKKMNTK
ncbi:Aminopeptidase N [Kordia antarctica]|uniref:Aminopeptidase N n=1 Tax=Kordia antarctica TaxID=1218801 RepID=A0A7L4ZDP5_9FLAO|nr:M1 family metallopeptidase [Kordia antarctica]QHI34883.1 Aminopeptidase N [Kordia antarctica]